jgi:hypothetical protein
MITTYLNALVEMLNENPPITLSALKENIRPFKVMGYTYEIECRASSDEDFILITILFKGKGKMYVVDTYNELYYWKEVWV